MATFDGKVALVTGGTRGIGRACVERLAADGAKVAFCGRSAETVAQVAAEIGHDVRGYVCDVTDPAAVNALIDTVGKELGPVVILVNNAGITRDGLLMRMKDTDLDEVLRTNLNATFYTCRAAARGMLKERYGRIINLTSIVGIHGQGGQTNYSAAKAGIIGFSKAYAQEVASRNITVNAVAPGLVETDMTSGLGEDTLKAIVERVPLKRAATPADVAAAVAFLASDDAAYITGHVLSVDGGLGM
jgi:3-oxoacyl-[acyl-carrier protein] reductase